MSIDITEHYKLALRQHNHAADHRVKIVNGWCLIAGGLAVAFRIERELGWIVTSVGIFATWFMWSLDIRTRDGLKDWRRIGADIEKTMPEKQRYFTEVSANLYSPKHGALIDNAAFGIVFFLVVTTIYFLWKGSIDVSGFIIFGKAIITLFALVIIYLCWEKWKKARDILTPRETWKTICRVAIDFTILLWVVWVFVLFQVRLSSIWVVTWVLAILQVEFLIGAIWVYVERYRRVASLFSPSKEEIKKKIQEKAYSLWGKKGNIEGCALEDWLQAEKEIKHDIFASY